MRGVNKLVMEIKSDGEYFEKALLFLKPGSTAISQHEITRNAEKLLTEISLKEKKKPHISAAPFLWTSLGAGIMWAIMLLTELLG